MLDRKCATCAFANPVGNDLFCQACPPGVSFIPVPTPDLATGGMRVGIQTVTGFPAVKPDQWCGEWQKP